MRDSHYDGFAEAYAKQNETGLFNASVVAMRGTRVLRVADLAEPLPFGDAEFDDVVASLVLHYLEDWSGPLAELRRVLKPGGRLLVSVNHPVIFPVVYPESDYFAVTRYTEDYDFSGSPRRSWATRQRSEPAPAPDTPPELLPDGLEAGRSFLCFLFFVLEAV